METKCITHDKELDELDSRLNQAYDEMGFGDEGDDSHDDGDAVAKASDNKSKGKAPAA